MAVKISLRESNIDGIKVLLESRDWMLVAATIFRLSRASIQQLHYLPGLYVGL